MLIAVVLDNAPVFAISSFIISVAARTSGELNADLSSINPAAFSYSVVRVSGPVAVPPTFGGTKLDIVC